MISQLKTDGYLSDRYRLAHWWVPERVLNVQSIFSKHKAIKETKMKLREYGGDDQGGDSTGTYKRDRLLAEFVSLKIWVLRAS